MGLCQINPLHRGAVGETLSLRLGEAEAYRFGLNPLHRGAVGETDTHMDILAGHPQS